MTTNLLDYIVAHWKSEFTGVSALTIASALDIRHEEILSRLFALAGDGKVSLRATRLAPMSLEADEDGRVRWQNEGLVDTQIAFPTRAVLEEAFRAEGLDHGPFTNHLHLGDSQVKNYFFNAEVLELYRRHPERYQIDDDILGGDVLARSDYYLALPEHEREDAVVSRLRYGKRRLRDGRIAIAVIVHDLSELPRREQMRWASYELEHPEFDQRDEDFAKFQRESFGAEFLDHDDPLEGIFAITARINQRLSGRLFLQEVGHPRLHYPVTNSPEAYRDAHRELFKVIGGDALSKGELQRLLTERIGIDPKELMNPGGQQKGSWALFRMLMARIPGVDLAPFNASWEARRQSAHEISDPAFSPEDFVARLRDDCEGILAGLKRLENWLASER